MDAVAERMEAQLKLWRSKIDGLAARTHMVGAQPGLDAVMDVDELKALCAIAESKLDAFRVAGDTGRLHRKTAMKKAWSELEAAFKNQNPRPLSGDRPRTRGTAESVDSRGRVDSRALTRGTPPSTDSRKRGCSP